MKSSQSGWNPPPDTPVATGAEVHLWRTTVDWPEASLAALKPLLSADERARVDRFYFEKDRRSHLVSRGWLRLIIGRYLGRPPQELAFATNGYGKPSLQPEVPLRFNVTHSGALVVVAVTLGRTLGVDVETIRPDTEVVELAERFFSVGERVALARVPAEQQRDAFFNGWTRKEAYLKAHGHGLSLPLDSFDVTLAPGEEARLLATRHDPAEAPRWELRAFDIAEGYKAALAVEGTGWSLACWDWPPDRPL
jgi:4'-phosphopantetheinyl transferase